MPQVLRPKKVNNEDVSNTVEAPVVAEIINATDINIREAVSSSSVGTETKNVVSSITPPSNLSASNIANRDIPPIEVHDQPTQPEISDALQKLLDMKVGKTLANAKASLEEVEPTILNKIGEVVIAKPNLGKEIKIPKPIEVLQTPIVNTQTINIITEPLPPVTDLSAPSVITSIDVNQQNNLQANVTTNKTTQEVPKKSLLDRLLGF